MLQYRPMRASMIDFLIAETKEKINKQINILNVVLERKLRETLEQLQNECEMKVQEALGDFLNEIEDEKDVVLNKSYNCSLELLEREAICKIEK